MSLVAKKKMVDSNTKIDKKALILLPKITQKKA